MKKYIKENKIIISVILVILVIGGLVYEGEKQKESKFTQEQEERCQKIAVQKKTDMKKENSDDQWYYDLLFFEYHYNSNTKMCVLAYIQHKESLDIVFSDNKGVITDLFTNKELYNKQLYIETRPGGAVRDDAEFRHVADLYFYQKEVRTP